MKPDFIPRDVFRAYLKPQVMNAYARIDGILVASYIARCERLGNPIRCYEQHGRKLYRLLDVVARARAEGHEVGVPESLELEHSIYSMRVELAELRRQFNDETARMADHAHYLAVSGASVALTGATLLREHEIVAGAFNLPHSISGVYFLVDGDHVAYVGQSVNIQARLGQHQDKKYDRVAYIPCRPAMLDALESLYIHYLQPPLNGRFGNKFQGKGNPAAPLRLDQLLRMAGEKEASDGRD